MDYCTLYTDGSGNYDWYQPYGKSPHKFHTLAGIILDPESDLKCKEKVCEILQNYIPEETRSLRPQNEYELHFDSILSGRGIYRKISKETRTKIINDTFELILELNPIIIASTVDKVKERESRGEKSFLPQPYAMRSVVHKFSMHLNRLEKIGSVIYDEDKIQFNSLLQEEIVKFRRYGIAIPGAMHQPKPDKLPNILNNINFCPSHLSYGLQLADFVAGAIWRKYERNDIQYYNLLNSLWE